MANLAPEIRFAKNDNDNSAMPEEPIIDENAANREQVKFQLKVVDPDKVVIKVIPLKIHVPMYVGRAIGCQIDLNDISVSRRHCVFHYKEFVVDGNGLASSGFCIYDLKSTHGTFLNNERLPQMQNVKLRHGDRLKFGAFSSDFIFEDLECGRSESVETAIGDTTLNTVHSTTGLSESSNELSVDQKLNMINSLVEQLKDEKKKPVMQLLKATLQKCFNRIARDSIDISQPDTTGPEDELEAELGRLHAQDVTAQSTMPLENLSQTDSLRSGYSQNSSQLSQPVKKPPLEPKRKGKKKAQPAEQNAMSPPEPAVAKRVPSGGPLTEHNADKSMITKRIGPISSKIIAQRSLQLLQQQQQRQPQLSNEQDPLAGFAGFDVDPFAAIPDTYVVPRGSTDTRDVPAPIAPPKVEQDVAESLFRKPKRPLSQMNGQQSDTSPPPPPAPAPVAKRKGRPPKNPRPDSSLSQTQSNISKELSVANDSADVTALNQSKKKGQPQMGLFNSHSSVDLPSEKPVLLQPANTTDLGKRVRKRRLAPDEDYVNEESSSAGPQAQLNETFPTAKKRGRKSKAELAAEAAALNSSAPMPLTVPTAAARKQHDTPLSSTSFEAPPKKGKGRPPKSDANKSPIKIVIKHNQADGVSSVSSIVVNDDSTSSTSSTRKKRGPYKKTIEKLKSSGKTEEEIAAEIASYVPKKYRLSAAEQKNEVASSKAKMTKRVSFPKYVEFNEEQRNQLVHSVPVIRLRKLNYEQISKLSKAPFMI